MSSVVVVGSFVQDLAFATEQFPEPGETRIGTFLSGPGGKGFNQAIACARAGCETTFIGALGQDIFAEGARSFAAANGVTALFEEIDSLSTGAASIVVNAQAENAIVVALGANDALGEAFVEAQRSGIEGAGVVLCQLENALAATERALSIAHAAGVLTILNPAPINDGFELSLLECVDILIPNESELSFLANKFFGRGSISLDADDAIREIHQKLGVKTLLVTCGEAGVICCDEQGAVQRMEAFSVPAVDTTGAGDAFCGGFAAQLASNNKDLPKAIEQGMAVAALSVTKKGTAPAMPSRTEVLDFLSSKKNGE